MTETAFSPRVGDTVRHRIWSSWGEGRVETVATDPRAPSLPPKYCTVRVEDDRHVSREVLVRNLRPVDEAVDAVDDQQPVPAVVRPVFSPRVVADGPSAA